MAFYAVSKGRIPGIYEDWLEAKVQVNEFPGAIFKLFKTRDEAHGAWRAQHIRCVVRSGSYSRHS